MRSKPEDAVASLEELLVLQPAALLLLMLRTLYVPLTDALLWLFSLM
jgi:hypothetical protein